MEPGKALPTPERNIDGHVPSMADDVILHAPALENSPEKQAALARAIGEVVWQSRLLSAVERRAEIEAGSRQALAATNE